MVVVVIHMYVYTVHQLKYTEVLLYVWAGGACSKSRSHTLVPTISKLSSFKLLYIVFLNNEMLTDICITHSHYIKQVVYNKQ